MRFEQFWEKLYVELKHSKRFKALKRHTSFEAYFADADTVIVTPDSTKIDRKVSSKEFEGMWNIMKNDIKSQRYVNTNKRYYTFWSSSYINALIDHIVKDQDMQ